MKKLIDRICRFLRLDVVMAVPAGMVADAQAEYGLIGLMSNVNAVSVTEANVTTAGTNSTLTGAQAIAGALILAAGASGGFTLTLPATSAIISALGATVPVDGTFSKILRVKNDNVGQTATVTVGDASTTLVGTMTIATDTTRTFLLTVTNGTAVVIENLGSMSL